MNIEAFLLCDAATEQQGKLNILGAFDTIWAKKLPVVYPSCAIALRIRFEISEQGDHPVKILIIDEDAKPVGPKVEGNVNVRVREGTDSTVANLILNIQRLNLDKYGQYRIDLTVDNQLVADLPLAVREVPSQAQ